MTADSRSSLVQIHQSVLDETNQSLKVSVVSGGGGGGGGGDVNLPAVVDATNSSTTPLGANGVFTGASFDAKDFATLSISVTSDRPSAVNGISVQYSQNGTNWDHIHAYTYVSGGLSYNLPLEMRYIRIVYTNGAVAQTSFRLQSVMRRTEVPPSVYTLEQGLNDYTVASPTKSVIYGKTTGGGGGYVAVKVNPSGALNTDVSGSVSVSNFPATQAVTGPLTDTQLRASAVPVSAASLPLPTGAATEASVQRLNSVERFRNNYATFNATTGGYLQLIASMPVAVKEIEIFDSSGESLVLAIGGSGAESDKVYVFPGGNGRIPLQIAVAQRLSIKAVSATANSGELLINFYG
jgi:hypothetical protein